MNQQTRHWLAQSDAHFALTRSDPRYPPLLNEIPDPPPILFVHGRDPDHLAQPSVAVVGSRKATSTGLALSQRLAKQLGQAGLTIISGMALGIDAAAHHGALEAPVRTVAVMACGLDRVYPRRHASLAEKIIQCGGFVVSEFSPGTPARPHQFIQRNRIISGLALGTLVVEASARSGSLTTARFAGEQGRDVFAVPGSVLSPNSVGCHVLLRDGAQLTENVNDVLAQLGWRNPSAKVEVNSDDTELTDDESRLLTLMGFDAVDIDELIASSGWSVPRVTAVLTTLQLRGLVSHQLGRGYQQVAFK